MPKPGVDSSQKKRICHWFHSCLVAGDHAPKLLRSHLFMDPPLSYLSKGNLQGWQQWVGNPGITPVYTDSDPNTAPGVTSVSSKPQPSLARWFWTAPVLPVSSVTLPGTSCNSPSTCPNQRKLRTQGRGKSPWIWGTSSPPTRGWGGELLKNRSKLMLRLMDRNE